MYRIGYCITAHGFGHAARAAAVMEALAGLVGVHWTIATTTPEWFFRGSRAGPYILYPLQVDVGLVQRTALDVDLPATVEALAGFYAGEEKILEQLSSVLRGCQLVICDISPLGLAAARRLKVPSVLVENFTWDWIYEQYRDACPELGDFIVNIRERCAMADYRIQSEPVCKNARHDLLAAPIARKRRKNRGEIRRKLNVGVEEKLVLVSMGGEGIRRLPPHIFAACPDTNFVVTGLKEAVAQQSNLRILREDSGFFHPDLVGACDAVIGKVGYSTLAEVYHAGVPFGYVARPDFRESDVLVNFIRQNMAGRPISADDFDSGAWIGMLPELLAEDGEKRPRTNGAGQCAEFIRALLHAHAGVAS